MRISRPHATKTSQLTDDLYVLFKSGMSLPWTGAISAIPSGFVLCDGNNGTPNLTDRFVIHADADAAGTRNVGDVGGSMAHTLTTNETPSHRHSIGISGVSGTTHAEGSLDAVATAYTGYEGGGAGHSILNRFYALALIMKT